MVVEVRSWRQFVLDRPIERAKLLIYLLSRFNIYTINLLNSKRNKPISDEVD